MINPEKALEFDKVKEIWASLALTERAKERIREIKPILSENELAARLRETTQARQMIEGWGNPPLVSLEGIRKWVGMAVKGDCLTCSQLEDIRLSLTAVKRLRQYLGRGRQQEIPLAYYDENLDCLEELGEAIVRQIRNGSVEDDASKLLKSLRQEIDKVECRMREKADSIMRAKKDCPVSVADYREELQLLRIQEENEERRILYTLTGMTADQAPVMEQNIERMEKLDFIFSKGKLSLVYGGKEPMINTGRELVIREGRHPLMDRKICVPLSLELGGRIRGMVITGPNTGGKTVAIKTAALSCMMAQCGLHVACEEARICMNSRFLCDIGDGQSLSENLSTFSAHIANVLEILEEIDEDSLVIMDELGSGTDPTEGMGLAIAILEELKNSGALFLVTTHYPEVKVYAQKEESVINARMTFDKESLKPLYQLVCGEAGESCALYIAKKMGMPSSMLRTAVAAAYGDGVPEGLEIVDESERQGDKRGSLKKKGPGIRRRKAVSRGQEEADRFCLGDSVMVYPDRKIGIVCGTANEKGVLRVQLQGKKIWINHKRVKLHVAAEKLYPEDYDFSIVFDSVENRKLRHEMDRKYVEGRELTTEE
ncbi:MAG: DNA mismatch repair protein MutS [Hungatella sp.]|nr:DNA mismatch repair protein MutS [Hungatella sp.]